MDKVFGVEYERINLDEGSEGGIQRTRIEVSNRFGTIMRFSFTTLNDESWGYTAEAFIHNLRNVWERNLVGFFIDANYKNETTISIIRGDLVKMGVYHKR